ncbi:MAG: hypothetical protein ACKVRN_14625 [Pyrinomonadaceae bacterium]
MKSENELKTVTKIESPTAKPRSRLRQALLTPLVCSILASLGIFGGISALVVGLFAVVIHGIFPADRIWDRVGTILLIVAIPMILVGSIFLDEIQIKR